MTGYGRGSAEGDNFSISVDVKTVNNRFLDVHLRLGGELAPLESGIKRQISSRLSRGRVDVTINLEKTSQTAYELNRPLIAGYVNALREMQTEFGIAGELDINLLARLPGALQPSRDGLSDDVSAGLEKALAAALDELERMRAQEGEALRSTATPACPPFGTRFSWACLAWRWWRLYGAGCTPASRLIPLPGSTAPLRPCSGEAGRNSG